MLIYLDSCGDHYGVSRDIESLWSYTAGWALDAEAPYGRGGSVRGSKFFQGNYAEMVVGFRFKADLPGSGTTPLLTLMDSGDYKTALGLDSVGRLALGAFTSGTSSLPGAWSHQSAPLVKPGVWHYAEFRAALGASAGVSARLNGVTALSATGVNTLGPGAGNAFANRLDFNGFDIDDLYACDTTGGVHDTFLGDLKVLALFPTGDVASGWTPSGAGSNHACVSEQAPDGDATHTGSNSVGAQDTFTLADLPGSVTAVLGVQTLVLANKDDIKIRTVAPVLNGAVGADAYQTVAYIYGAQCWDVNPAGGAWTPAAVNAATMGYKLTQ